MCGSGHWRVHKSNVSQSKQRTHLPSRALNVKRSNMSLRSGATQMQRRFRRHPMTKLHGTRLGMMILSPTIWHFIAIRTVNLIETMSSLKVRR